MERREGEVRGKFATAVLETASCERSEVPHFQPIQVHIIVLPKQKIG